MSNLNYKKLKDKERLGREAQERYAKKMHRYAKIKAKRKHKPLPANWKEEFIRKVSGK
jgi:hypothetical protein